MSEESNGSNFALDSVHSGCTLIVPCPSFSVLFTCILYGLGLFWQINVFIRAYYVGGGKEANCLHMEVGGNFPSLGGDFTKIILMRATVVRSKSGENKKNK